MIRAPIGGCGTQGKFIECLSNLVIIGGLIHLTFTSNNSIPTSVLPPNVYPVDKTIDRSTRAKPAIIKNRLLSTISISLQIKTADEISGTHNVTLALFSIAVNGEQRSADLW